MVLPWKWLIGFCLSFCLTLAAGESTVTFEKKKIKLAKQTITVEVAQSEAQHERGLMLREKLGPREGMLFVFKDEQIRSFWMKNTIINLSIGYFNKERKLIDIQEMKAITTIMQQDLPVYPSQLPAMYALEMAEGWFKKNQIAVGAQFRFL